MNTDNVGEFTEHSPSASLIGTTVGSYRIVEMVGAGGMGEVYVALDTRLDRRVALKFLSSRYTSDAGRVHRFRQEARAASSLNHPNILTIHELGEHDGVQFIASELVEGETLRERMAHGPLQLSEVVRVASQVASALRATHTAGVVHRDIKPENIMLRPDGYVKVLDFGLAKLSETLAPPADETTALQTVTGVVMGTTPYMSPEQLRGQHVDARTDQWSLGVVLFEMLSGRRPFEGSTGSDVVAAILGKEHPPLHAPEELRRITTKLLRKRSEERYPTANELCTDLASFQKQIEAEAVSPRGKLRLAAVVVGLVIAVASVVMLNRDRIVHDKASAPPVPPVANAPATGRGTRVVVLPFENLTQNPGDDWLSPALAISLTYGLQSLEDLIVVNPDRVAELYKQQSVRQVSPLDANVVRRLVELLHVKYYVHGSYQRVGDDIKVVARLADIDAATIGAQESVIDRFANILQLEDDLARRFATRLASGKSTYVKSHETSSVEAYQAFIEARMLYGGGDVTTDVVDRLKRAVALDPEYAQAWALLAKTHARLAGPASVTGDPGHEHRRQSILAAQRAAEMNPSLYDAHVALALAHRENGQNGAWRAEAQRAIELNPRQAEGYALLGDSFYTSPVWGCARDRNVTLADNYYRQAIAVDPRFAAAYANRIGSLRWGGQPQRALEAADEALRMLPTSLQVRRQRSETLIALNRIDEAERGMQELIRGRTPSAIETLVLGAIDLRRGRDAEAEKKFSQVMVLSPAVDYELIIGSFYATAAHPDEARAYLTRAFEQDPACARFVAWSPMFAPFAAQPQTRALLAKYGAK